MNARRSAYGLRAFIPGLREHHRLESMVGPLGFWRDLQRYQMRALQSNGLKSCNTLLDVGCGPLQGGIAFIKYLRNNGYTGVDHKPDCIETARQQVIRHKLVEKNPELIVSTSFGYDELRDRKYDFIWASQILCFLNHAAMDELFRTIRLRLNRDGKFLGDIYHPDHYEFKYPETIGRYVQHTPDSMQALAAKNYLRCRCLGPIEEFGYPRRLSLRTNLLFEITSPL